MHQNVRLDLGSSPLSSGSACPIHGKEHLTVTLATPRRTSSINTMSSVPPSCLEAGGFTDTAQRPDDLLFGNAEQLSELPLVCPGSPASSPQPVATAWSQERTAQFVAHHDALGHLLLSNAQVLKKQGSHMHCKEPSAFFGIATIAP